jgi:hypothetical protein
VVVVPDRVHRVDLLVTQAARLVRSRLIARESREFRSADVRVRDDVVLDAVEFVALAQDFSSNRSVIGRSEMLRSVLGVD